jgi:hypothetical protein
MPSPPYRPAAPAAAAVHRPDRPAEGAGGRGRLEHPRPGAGCRRLQARRPLAQPWRAFTGREQIIAFLRDKWASELDYALRKSLWAFTDDRIAVRFQYEWHALLRQREQGVHQRRVHEPPRSQHQRRPDQRGRPTHPRAAPSWHLRRPAPALTPPVPPVAPALADDHPAYCAARTWRTATSHWHDSLDCRSCGVSPGDRLPVTKSVTIKEADECRGELVGGFLGHVVAAGDGDPA